MIQTDIKPIAQLSTEERPLLRINFNPELRHQMPKSVSNLVVHLYDELAADLQITRIDAARYLNSRDTTFNQFALDILRYKGWKIRYWQLPDPDTKAIFNCGYEIEEKCERLIQYKLDNS